MENKTAKREFNRRAFTSVALFVSGLFLPVSGYMNHQLQFEEMTILRHFWMSVHNMAAVLFIIFIIMHLSFNWRALLNHVNHAKKVVLSKEALLAVVIVIGMVMLFSSHAFRVGVR